MCIRDRTGTTTAAAVTVSGAVQVGATAGLVVGASGPKVLSGSGSPEGAITAGVGSVYLRTDGGADTVAYWKTSGTGSSGWTAVDTGTGDVVGPASATDNALARFDGTTGKLVQNSGIIVDGSNNVSGVGTLGCGAITTSGNLTVSKASPAISASATSGNAISILNRASGSAALWYVQTSNSTRWTFGGNSSAESSGTSAGTNFIIQRHDDTGAIQSIPLQVTRSTGKITLGDVGATAGLELGSSGPRVMSGTGSPEGVVTAPVGSLWVRTDGGADTVAYWKTSGSGNTGWTAVDTGTGDVVGPASATDNALARFDGTTGKLVQNSGITVDDSGNVTSVGTVSATGLAGSLLSSATPQTSGIAAAGTATVPARQDHVHPPELVPVVAVGERVSLTSYVGVTGAPPSSQGVMYVWSLWIPHAMTISRLALRIGTAAAAGGLLRMGFYSLDGTGSTPSSLVADCGTLDPTTSGIKAITGLSVAFTASGRYAVAMALQGSGAGGGTFFGAAPLAFTDTGSGTRVEPSHTGWMVASGVTGALPATITPVPTAQGIPPALVVERSA